MTCCEVEILEATSEVEIEEIPADAEELFDGDVLVEEHVTTLTVVEVVEWDGLVEEIEIFPPAGPPGEPGSDGAGHTIEDEAGDDLPQRANLQFVGPAVAVTDDEPNDRTIVTISASGSGGGVPSGYWSPMSNGWPQHPEVIFDAVTGDVMMIWVEA